MIAHKTKVKKLRDAAFESAYSGCFVASCSCGWESGKRSRAVRAELEADDHKAQASAKA